MNNRYTERMESVRFSPTEKAALTTRLRETAAQKAATRRPSGRRALVAALAAALCLSGAALAVSGLASDWLRTMFGDKNLSVMNDYGHVIGESASLRGVTVTADAVIMDANYVYIAFTFTNDDGTPFVKSAEERWDCTVLTTVSTGYADRTLTATPQFFEEAPGGDRLKCLARFDFLDLRVPRTLDLTISPLGHVGPERKESDVVASGYRRLTISLGQGEGYVGVLPTYPDAPGSPICLGDALYRITSAAVSPVRLSFDVAGVSTTDAPLPDFWSQPIYLRLNDGTRLRLNDEARRESSPLYTFEQLDLSPMYSNGERMDVTGYGSPRYAESVRFTCLFDEIIDPYAAEAIEIGDSVFPLS